MLPFCPEPSGLSRRPQPAYLQGPGRFALPGFSHSIGSAEKSQPGRRVRLQIRRGLSGELHTVEITLPPDFAVGKPVRLRGLGKRVGPWQGDLYLTLYNE